MSANSVSVRVYRSLVAGSSLYMGNGFVDTKESNGFVRFAPAGNPARHPHNHEEFLYQYGEFCTGDTELIAAMDAMIKRGTTLFYAVTDPIPLEDLDLDCI